MIISINETMRIVHTSTCYVIQERRNTECEFQATRYFTTLPKALKRAFELTEDNELKVELKDVASEVNKAINKFVENIEIKVGDIEL